MDKSCLLYWTLLSYFCSFQRWKSRYDHVWILDLHVFFIFQEFSYFLVPLFMFLIILYLFKYVSLGSICASVCSSLYITAQLLSLDVNNLFIILASWLMTLLVIYRHSANIKRIQEGTENKVSWL